MIPTRSIREIGISNVHQQTAIPDFCLQMRESELINYLAVHSPVEGFASIDADKLLENFPFNVNAFYGDFLSPIPSPRLLQTNDKYL